MASHGFTCRIELHGDESDFCSQIPAALQCSKRNSHLWPRTHRDRLEAREPRKFQVLSYAESWSTDHVWNLQLQCFMYRKPTFTNITVNSCWKIKQKLQLTRQNYWNAFMASHSILAYPSIHFRIHSCYLLLHDHLTFRVLHESPISFTRVILRLDVLSVLVSAI